MSNVDIRSVQLVNTQTCNLLASAASSAQFVLNMNVMIDQRRGLIVVT